MISRTILRTLICLVAAEFPATAHAQNPLATNDWTQVGALYNDGTMFNGNCNLDLSGACTYASQTDFWRSFPNANQILFITGDRQFWGHAWYADVWSIIQGATAEFAPNLKWIDAGRSGTSLGSITGNLLFREGLTPEIGNIHLEDPWVTLEGRHCANEGSGEAACAEVLWGETAYPQPVHTSLMREHGGLEVWAREYLPSTSVPEPSGAALLFCGVFGVGLVAYRRRCSQ